MKTDTERLADMFLTLLREALGETNYRNVCTRNAKETNPNVCHSHDYCDANIVMADAFGAMGLPTPGMDDDTSLWSAAWGIAFRRMQREGILPRCPMGWEIISTGGGCEAWYRLLRGYMDAYAMITDVDGATVPQGDGDVMLGIYPEQGGQQLVSFQLPLAQALKLAERVVAVQDKPREGYAANAYLTDADEQKADKAEARARNGR